MAKTKSIFNGILDSYACVFLGAIFSYAISKPTLEHPLIDGKTVVLISFPMAIIIASSIVSGTYNWYKYTKNKIYNNNQQKSNLEEKIKKMDFKFQPNTKTFLLEQSLEYKTENNSFSPHLQKISDEICEELYGKNEE